MKKHSIVALFFVLSFASLSIFFVSCGANIATSNFSFVLGEEFAQKIQSSLKNRSIVQGRADIAEEEQDDFVTIEVSLQGTYSKTQSKKLSLSELANAVFTFTDIPLNATFDIYITVTDSEGFLLYEGSKSNVTTLDEANSVQVSLSKLLNTQTLLYSYSAENYQIKYDFGQKEYETDSYQGIKFCFDSDGNLYIASGTDILSFVYFDGVSDAKTIAIKDQSGENVQITSGYLTYDYKTDSVYVIDTNYIYKFSSLQANSSTDTANEADYEVNVTQYYYGITDLEVEEIACAACIYNNIDYIVFKTSSSATNTSGTTSDESENSYTLLGYDISSAKVSEDSEEMRIINEPFLNTKICSDMELSSYAEISDMICIDGNVYILLKDIYEFNDETNQNYEEAAIYSRGAVIKYDGKTTSTLGWTKSELDNTDKYFYGYSDDSVLYQKSDDTVSKYKVSASDILTIFSPSNDSGFYGPRKFIAIKPKNLIIADEGLAFFADNENAYNYKNINRIVTIDLESFTISSSKDSDNSFEYECTLNPLSYSKFSTESSATNDIYTDEDCTTRYTNSDNKIYLGIPCEY